MTPLHITVGDRAQFREETLQFIQQAETDELDASNERTVLEFGTYADLVGIRDSECDLENSVISGLRGST